MLKGEECSITELDSQHCEKESKGGLSRVPVTCLSVKMVLVFHQLQCSYCVCEEDRFHKAKFDGTALQQCVSWFRPDSNPTNSFQCSKNDVVRRNLRHDLLTNYIRYENIAVLAKVPTFWRSSPP